MSYKQIHFLDSIYMKTVTYSIWYAEYIQALWIFERMRFLLHIFPEYFWIQTFLGIKLNRKIRMKVHYIMMLQAKIQHTVCILSMLNDNVLYFTLRLLVNFKEYCMIYIYIYIHIFNRKWFPHWFWNKVIMMPANY